MERCLWCDGKDARQRYWKKRNGWKGKKTRERQEKHETKKRELQKGLQERCSKMGPLGGAFDTKGNFLLYLFFSFFIISWKYYFDYRINCQWLFSHSLEIVATAPQGRWNVHWSLKNRNTKFYNSSKLQSKDWKIPMRICHRSIWFEIY